MSGANAEAVKAESITIASSQEIGGGRSIRLLMIAEDGRRMFADFTPDVSEQLSFRAMQAAEGPSFDAVTIYPEA